MKEEKKLLFNIELITCFSSFTTLHKDTNSISHKKEKKSFREKKCSCR